MHKAQEIMEKMTGWYEGKPMTKQLILDAAGALCQEVNELMGLQREVMIGYTANIEDASIHFDLYACDVDIQTLEDYGFRDITVMGWEHQRRVAMSAPQNETFGFVRARGY